MNTINAVKQFHELFDHPVLKQPTIPSRDRIKLRIELLEEELKELKEAAEEGNLIEAMDAFCDLQYVLNGAILEFGMQDKFDKAFKEVHRSNMSKGCNTIDEAERTVKKYNDDGQPSHFVGTQILNEEGWPIKELYLVYRNADNKLLKSVNYSPANLRFVTEK